jgi:hypothetical protein
VAAAPRLTPPLWGFPARTGHAAADVARPRAALELHRGSWRSRFVDPDKTEKFRMREIAVAELGL